MEILLLGAVAGYLGAIFMSAHVAAEKGKNPFAWIILAIVVTPLCALIALAALPNER